MTHPEDLSALSHLAPELARTFVTVASDIALVLDSNGVILNVVSQSPTGSVPATGDWVGKRWGETVTGETRGKIDQLLKEVTSTGLSRRREVNHPSASGADIPIAYSAVRLGEHGPVLAVGRDLRAVAAIQQRFVDAQQEMERDYWQHRQAESRYRLLFHVATDAVFVVDAETSRVVDANQATSLLFDLALDNIIGKSAVVGIDPSFRHAVEEMLATARATGRPAEIRARIVGKRTYASISATPFRSDDTMLLLVRARATSLENSGESPTTYAQRVEQTTQPVLVTDSSGHVLTTSPAFLALSGCAHERDAKGKPLGDWLGSIGSGSLAALIKTVKARGISPPVRASLITAAGRAVQVEITAALLEDEDQERIGFTLRCIADETKGVGDSMQGLTVALASIATRVGCESLPKLVEQGVELFERHLVALALDSCNGDAGLAAQVLGISSAQLEVRLRQHGLVPRPVS